MKTFFNFLWIMMLVCLNHAVGDENFRMQMDPSTEHNKAHLKEDLDGVIDKSPEDMDPTELQFHYFRQHDYDGDEKLDGNELGADFIQLNKNQDNMGAVVDERLIIEHVDQLMKQTDVNDDGYIDFHEYKMYMRKQ